MPENNYESRLNIIDSNLGKLYLRQLGRKQFWNNIATPINLLITIISAVVSTRATAETENLIPNDIYKYISVALLVLTGLNTYYKPHSQYHAHTTKCEKISDIGKTFLRIKTNINNDNTNNISDKIQELEVSLNKYIKPVELWEVQYTDFITNAYYGGNSSYTNICGIIVNPEEQINNNSCMNTEAVVVNAYSPTRPNINNNYNQLNNDNNDNNNNNIVSNNDIELTINSPKEEQV